MPFTLFPFLCRRTTPTVVSKVPNSGKCVSATVALSILGNRMHPVQEMMRLFSLAPLRDGATFGVPYTLEQLSGMSNQIVLSPRYCSFEQIAHSCKGSVLQVDCLVQASVLRQNELSSLGRPEFQMVLPGLCGQALERALKKADKLGLYARPASLRMGTSVAVLNLLLRQELLAAPYCVAASTRGGKRIAIAPTTSGGVRVSMARPEVSHPFLMVLSNRR